MPLDASELYNTIRDPMTGEWLQVRHAIAPMPPKIKAIDIRHYAPNVYNSSLTVMRECSGIMKDQRYLLADTCREIQKDEG